MAKMKTTTNAVNYDVKINLCTYKAKVIKS